MLFGANMTCIDAAMASAAVNTVRWYFPPDVGVPSHWPLTPAGLKGIVSFRPNLDEWLAGSLDQQAAHFLEGAPPKSWVMVWHEANSPDKQIDPVKYKAACVHLQNLVHQYNPSIFTVQSLNCYPPVHKGQDLRLWVQPGLWAYLLDGYQLTDNDTPVTVFDLCRDSVLAVHPTAVMGISETNSMTNPNVWGRAVFSYALQKKMRAFAFFADPGTPPPVFPSLPSPTVLHDLAQQAALAHP